jgi:hypothetical protein
MTSPMARSAGAATLAAAPVRGEMIVLWCPQYRRGGQDVATDRALRAATIALTQRCIGNGSAVLDSF